MSEVMAQRQPMKPTYAIPIIPVTNSSPFKHQEAMELKEFKVKVSSISSKITIPCCHTCKMQHSRVGGSFLKLKICAGKAAIRIKCFILLELGCWLSSG